MILLPAIDIRDGKAVRLEQGDFARETVYSASPVEVARAWQEQGADVLHVVDLDGAREGEPVNLDQLERIRALGVAVQYGGGLRSRAAVERALDAGATRVVVGTAAYRDEELLDWLLEACAERARVAVDVRGGRVAVAGWAERTVATPEELIERVQARGSVEFVYTNADRDGMLEGLDLDEVRRVDSVVRWGFAYSGGIGSLADLEGLAAAGLEALSEVICGKAFYERRFSFAEAQATLDRNR